MLAKHKLHTVCQEANCPNISECFNNKTATFLILGPYCTRTCVFCSIEKHCPEPPDTGEIDAICSAVKYLGLSYCVITSVTRDDLPDGGADFFCQVVQALKKRFPDIEIELLVPDFNGNTKALELILKQEISVFNHNIETVPDLYTQIRPQADYRQSLSVLETAAQHGYKVKTGLMAGLGENDEQIFRTLDDIKKTGCKIITIGQYLQPSLRHFPVKRYVTLRQFEEYAKYGQSIGIKKMLCGPFVRSSYHAGETAQTCCPETKNAYDLVY